jgi:DNA modification methylase
MKFGVVRRRCTIRSPELYRKVGQTLLELLLGPHRVICGNAADTDLVSRLMRTEVARMVLTEAPFLVAPVAVESHVSASDHRHDRTASRDITDAPSSETNQSWIKAVDPHLVDGGLLGSFIDWRNLPLVQAAAAALGLTPIDLVVWTTTSAGQNGLYKSRHVLLPLFRKGSAAPVNSNGSVGKHGRHRTNVWSYSAPSDRSDARGGRQGHPTLKPAAMLEDTLTDLTNRGELVLDPFLGAGSTLIAAENTGRVCCGIEADPFTVDVIIRRYQVLTGKAAIMADPSMTFEQIAARRDDDERR